VTIPDLFRNCLTNPYLVQMVRQPPCRSLLGSLTVALPGIKTISRNDPQKTEFVGVRMSPVELQVLRAEATRYGMTISELIRRRITGQPVTSRTDQKIAASIDRLGRMLKFLYPKDNGWASPEDRMSL